MNKIWKAAMALGVGLVMSAGAYAQSGDQQQGPPPQRDGMRGEGRGPGRGMPSPEERLKRMTEQLNLTADQQAKIKPLMESEKAAMDKLRDDTSTAPDAKRESAMKIRKETQEAIRATLTTEQQAKFDKQQEEMRQRGPRGTRPDGKTGDKSQN